MHAVCMYTHIYIYTVYIYTVYITCLCQSTVYGDKANSTKAWPEFLRIPRWRANFVNNVSPINSCFSSLPNNPPHTHVHIHISMIFPIQDIQDRDFRQELVWDTKLRSMRWPFATTERCWSVPRQIKRPASGRWTDAAWPFCDIETRYVRRALEPGGQCLSEFGSFGIFSVDKTSMEVFVVTVFSSLFSGSMLHPIDVHY